MATRRERVVLDLQDDFTGPMLRAAAAAKLAKTEIDGLGKTSTRSNASSRGSSVAFNQQARSLDDLERNARRAERTSSLLADTAITLGPAFGGIAALAVPAVAGLSTQLGFAAAGAGSAILAFHGVSDALKSLDAYQLEPTTANLEKLHATMAKLGPSGRDFVRELDRLEPQLKSLKIAAEDGLLPGAGEGLESLLTLLPQVRSIISEVSGTTGDLLADAGKNLAGPEFRDFFSYLETEARPILSDLGKTIGNFAAGFAHLFVGFTPLERDFSDFMLSVSRDFDAWAKGLDKTAGFADFLDYIHQTGPDVAEALGAISGAFVAIVQAGAPLSGPVLDGVTALAGIIERIADSDVGTPLIVLASGIALVNRALATSALAKNSLVADLLLGKSLDGGGRGANGFQRTGSGIQSVSTRAKAASTDLKTLATSYATVGARSERETARISAASGRLKSSLAPFGKGAAVAGAFAIASTGAADSIGLTNTASLALAGTLAGPWGAAVGGAIGGVLDLNAAVDHQRQSLAAWAKEAPTATLEKTRAQLEATRDSLTKRTPAQNLVSATAGYGANGSSQNEVGSKDVRKLAAVNKELELRGATSGAANVALLRSGLVLTAQGADIVSESTAKFEARITDLSVTLSARSSLTSYKSALLDIGDALKKNGRTLDLNSRAGLANRTSLESLASTALARAKDLEDAGKRTQSIRFLNSAKKDLADAAVAFGLPRAQARKLAAQLLDLGAVDAKPTVTLIDKATGKISGVRGQLLDLDGTTATTYIKTVLGGSGSGSSPKKKAGGGYISGPGGPTEDRIPAMLSNGEYVIRAAAVNYYGAGVLDQINAQHFAGGGHVKHKKQPTVSLNSVVAQSAGVSLATLQAQDGIASDQAQIDDLVSQLNEQTLVGKKGHKHYVYAAVGSARTALETSLRVAVQQLAADQAALAAGTYSGGPSDASNVDDTASALADTRAQTADSLFGSFDLFSRGTSSASAERYAAQFEQDVNAYSSAIQMLIAAGAGSGVLKNIERVAESGDYKSAAKLARNLASNPAALGHINADVYAAQQQAAQLSAIVNSAAFAPGNIGIQGGSRDLNINMNTLEPTVWLQELRRTVTHEVTAQMAQAVG